MNHSSDKPDPITGHPKPEQQSTNNRLEFDLEKLVDRQNQESDTSSLRSESAKTPKLDVETPAVPNPQQDDSIADIADKTQPRARKNSDE